MHKRQIENVVIGERAALVTDLRAIDPLLWERSTACGSWNVREVVAHLVDTARITRTKFVRDMIVARGDFDRANARGIARALRDDSRDLLADFADVVGRTSGPPAPIATRLVEIIVHGEDVRRALDVDHIYPTEAVEVALRHQLRTTVKFGGGRELAAGRRVVAVDTDLVSGSGPELRGTVLELLVMLSGRCPVPSPSA